MIRITVHGRAHTCPANIMSVGPNSVTLSDGGGVFVELQRHDLDHLIDSLREEDERLAETPVPPGRLAN